MLDDDEDEEVEQKIQIPRHKILATDMDENLRLKILECKNIKIKIRHCIKFTRL